VSGVVITKHATLDAGQALAVRDLVGAFDTAVVYRVDASDLGFVLSEQKLDPPLHKRYPQPDVSAGEPLWDLVLLAAAHDETVAMAATTFSAWNRRQILNELHVAPAWRRRGVGKRLLAAVFDEAGRNRAREVWLETQNVNVPAIHAYRRLGFRITGLDTTFYDGPADAEVAIYMSAPVGT